MTTDEALLAAGRELEGILTMTHKDRLANMRGADTEYRELIEGRYARTAREAGIVMIEPDGTPSVDSVAVVCVFLAVVFVLAVALR